ncbi:MAG: hypothetical protein ACI4T3_04160 [Lactobacillus sp.]
MTKQTEKTTKDNYSNRLEKALKSKDYVEFDSAKAGLDWLND